MVLHQKAVHVEQAARGGVMAQTCWSSRGVWTAPLDIGFEFGMVLCTT